MGAMRSEQPVDGECGVNICQDGSNKVQATCRGECGVNICQDGSDEIRATCRGGVWSKYLSRWER